jgi:ketosteroid isomerase-like protein
MKKSIFIAALFISLIGCTSQQGEQLTQEQKDQIKKEVKVTLDSIFAKFERLDLDAGLQYYSPELVVVGGGSIMDYQTSMKGWRDYFGSVATANWTMSHLEFVVLTNDIVISAWVGKLKLVLKSGDKLTIDPLSYTDVYRKSGGQWKVIYEASSGVPVKEEAGKK